MAVLLGNYDLVWVLIEQFGFDSNYYNAPYNQMTLLHVIARYRTNEFTDNEKESVRRLI